MKINWTYSAATYSTHKMPVCVHNKCFTIHIDEYDGNFLQPACE